MGLGYEISVKKTFRPSTVVGDRGGWWWPIVRELFTGAWQRNMERSTESVLANDSVYACIERIASDIGKCRIKSVEQDGNGIWNEIDFAAFLPCCASQIISRRVFSFWKAGSSAS